MTAAQLLRAVFAAMSLGLCATHATGEGSPVTPGLQGIPTCRLDGDMPPTALDALQRAWSEIGLGQAPAPAVNPLAPVPAPRLSVFFVRDALEGSDTCPQAPPGLGDGELRAFDPVTVAGVCQVRQGSLICSSDAIRAILGIEQAVEAEFEHTRTASPTLVYIFSHEFGHVMLHHPGAFSEGVAPVALGPDREANVAALAETCQRDGAQIAREQEADDYAFDKAQHVYLRPPYRSGSNDMQAVVANTEIVYWTGKTFGNWAAAYYGGPSEQPFPNDRQLCALVGRRSGTIVMPVRGGDHPSPWARLAGIVNQEGRFVDGQRRQLGLSLESSDVPSLDMNRMTDTLLARAFDAQSESFCRRVRDLENGTLDCGSVQDEPDGAQGVKLDVDVAAPPEKLPVDFKRLAPYREVAGTAVNSVVLSLGSYNSAPTIELARVEAGRMAQAYAAFARAVDEALHSGGGYWVVDHLPDVETTFNRFNGQYMSVARLTAVLRAPASFDPRTLPAFQPLRRWGRQDDVYVSPWNASLHEVVIHFFRPEAPRDNDNPGSQRVLTRALRFDEIFDLEAARSLLDEQPAPLFRELLPYLNEKLKARFGGRYTLDHDVFYITAGGIGDNLPLPPAWWPLIDSTSPRAIPDAELSQAVDRIYVDNATQEDVAAIFPH